MLARLSLVLWMLGLSLAISCHAQTIAPSAFSGTWRVVKFVGFAEVSGGPPVVRQLTGATMIISPEKISIDADDYECSPRPKFVTRRVDTAEFLESEAGAAMEDVMPPHPYPQLSKEVVVLDSDNCLTVFWLGNGYIEFDHVGVFVVAKRVIDSPK